MKRKSFMSISTILFISLAIFAGLLLYGNPKPVSAEHSVSGDLTALDAGDVSAYRWQAMGDYYLGSQTKDLTTLGVGDVAAYRWQAMAEYYLGSQTKDLTTLDAGDVSAYRWQAMAEYYLGSAAGDLISQ
jgi:hypothetical protein